MQGYERKVFNDKRQNPSDQVATLGEEQARADGPGGKGQTGTNLTAPPVNPAIYDTLHTGNVLLEGALLSSQILGRGMNTEGCKCKVVRHQQVKTTC